MDKIIYIVVSVFVVVAILIFLYWGIIMIKKTLFTKEQQEQQPEQDEPTETEKMPYIATKLLTRREYAFFKALQPIAQKYNLMICPKVRLADLAAVPQGTKDIKWFNYIKAKHVDFTICDKDLNVKLVIELDDSTHNQPDRQTRDDFVDRVFKQINIKLIHIREWGSDLEQVVTKELNITPTGVSSNTL